MLASLWEERGAGLLSHTASSSVASSCGGSAAAVATSGMASSKVSGACSSEGV